MFERIKQKKKVEDIMKGMIVKQENEGEIVMEEGIEGREKKFEGEMKKREKEIGI